MFLGQINENPGRLFSKVFASVFRVDTIANVPGEMRNSVGCDKAKRYLADPGSRTSKKDEETVHRRVTHIALAVIQMNHLEVDLAVCQKVTHISFEQVDALRTSRYREVLLESAIVSRAYTREYRGYERCFGLRHNAPITCEGRRPESG